MTVIDTKQEYRKHLQIVKNDANGKSVRKESYDKMVELYKEILKVEPNCDIETPEQVKIKFIDKMEQPNVIWSKDELIDSERTEMKMLERVRTIAYNWVKQNHPNENDQSDKFGQIVNARMQLIIASRN